MKIDYLVRKQGKYVCKERMKTGLTGAPLIHIGQWFRAQKRTMSWYICKIPIIRGMKGVC